MPIFLDFFQDYAHNIDNRIIGVIIWIWKKMERLLRSSLYNKNMKKVIAWKKKQKYKILHFISVDVDALTGREFWGYY